MALHIERLPPSLAACHSTFVSPVMSAPCLVVHPLTQRGFSPNRPASDEKAAQRDSADAPSERFHVSSASQMSLQVQFTLGHWKNNTDTFFTCDL